MSRKLILLLVFCLAELVCLTTKAQYVAIPDSNFTYWLNVNIPSAMNGNMMDTADFQLRNRTDVTLPNKNISNLFGIQYFAKLYKLDCSNNALTSLPILPSSTKYLHCIWNQIDSLSDLPAGLVGLYCGGNNQLKIATLPPSLIYFDCAWNFSDTLPPLPLTLKDLNCSINSLTSLPALPPALIKLNCYSNQLSNLPALPNSLQGLYCYNNQLTSLPALPNSLGTIQCANNKITLLPALPSSLVFLDCGANELTSLPNLPASLNFLACATNRISVLPVLPNSVTVLFCADNGLQSLPILPQNLNWLDCEMNLLTSLPLIPPQVYQLNCRFNLIDSLPPLPNNLLYFTCNNNLIHNLPVLPPLLKEFTCHRNLISSLPPLPIGLEKLICTHNLLNSLSPLPNTLTELICDSNQLSTLPILPPTLFKLNCSKNNIFCFPEFPQSLLYSVYFNINDNPYTCLPNHVPAMNAILLSKPLCGQNNIVSNGSDCAFAQGAIGYTYTDVNANCVKDSADNGFTNIPLNLYSSNATFLAKTYSFADGRYNFVKPMGTYLLAVDTLNMPFTVACASPGVDSVIQIGASNLLPAVNFPIVCKGGFDLGVQSIHHSGQVFPGLNHILAVDAGDASHRYGLNCAAGISGRVQLTVTGPLNYIGPVAGALTPIVQGNVYTFEIADFGSISNAQAFNLQFKTDTSAQANDAVCVQVSIVGFVAGDYLGANNLAQYCYKVTNSYDPNSKEVFPVGNIVPGSTDWLTYTIHFQNTGNAAAQNVHLLDTLDFNLNPESFELLNFSHPNAMSLDGNVLNFSFKNIMLPDSGANLQASQGFVQYRIRPKNNLILGNEIMNRAAIYFDYNPPVFTNTVKRMCAQENGITLHETACDSFILNGYTYRYAGIYSQILRNSQGLDSTISLHLTLNKSEAHLQQTACEPFLFNGQMYTASGIYVQHLTNSWGCDSTIFLKLTVHDNSSSNLTVAACDSFNIGTNTYTASGSYSCLLPNAKGCDSLVTLHLTLKHSTLLNTSQSACNSYFVNGTTYTSSGMYTLPFINAAGCASTWNLNLTIFKLDTTVTQTGLQLISNQSAAYYQWLDCDHGNIPLTQQTAQIFNAFANGNYAVVINQNGCSDTSACYSVLSVGEEESANVSEFQLSPNPAAESTMLYCTARGKNLKLCILSLSGQVLFQKTTNHETQIKLDLSALAHGIYYLQIQEDTKLNYLKLLKK